MDIKEFENIRDMAKLKAISKISLERELTETEFKEMMILKDKLF